MPWLSFEGRPVEFHDGDTIASALHRAGVRTLSRSFKYHRRRGLYCLTGDCPNCMVSVDREPGVRACGATAREGQRVEREGGWPSADFDVLAIAWRLRRWLPVGWYYKTMVRPWMWRLCEPVIRRLAGRAAVPEHLAPEDRPAVHLHADVLVAGGGAAGLAAALAASDRGDRVVVADEGSFGDKVAPGSTRAQIDELVGSLRCRPDVTLLEHAAVIGVYEGPMAPVVTRDATLLVHPQRVIVATGATEEHAVFSGSDLPGVWLGRGAARMAGVHGVRPGNVAVVSISVDEGLEHLATLQRAGVSIAAVVAPAGLADRLPEGLRVIRDGRVVAARGSSHVTAVVVAGEGGESRIDCDTLVLSLGLLPRSNLLRQAVSEPVRGAGEVLLPGCTLEAALASGRQAALDGTAPPVFDGSAASPDSTAEQPPDAGSVSGVCGEGIVCLCEDVSVHELETAWDEGFRSTELLKRYTTATMGPCQGAMCHAHLREFVQARSPQAPFNKATTARPPARPLRVQDAAAGLRYLTEQRTALHDRHLQAGAHMAWFGAWKRPAHYGDPRAEYDAVRHGVGIMDVGTLGKFLVAGPDATEFLERLFPCHVASIPAGRLRYTVSLNEAGYIFDDGLVCNLGDDGYYVTLTTAGADRGEAYMKDWAETWGLRVHIVNRTAARGAVNVAGPGARHLLRELTDSPLDNESLPFAAHREMVIAGIPCRVLRLGFVGELSYELHHPSSRSTELWDSLLAAGEPMGVRPHGVDALLQLRLEKGHVVIGMDTDFDCTPAKAGMDWAVKRDKEWFVGKTALQRLDQLPVDKKLCGFVFAGEGAPVPGTTLTVDGTYVGYLSSSGYSPALGHGVAMGWLRRLGGEFPEAVHAAGRIGKVVAPPFYDPEGTRVRS